MRKKLVLSMLTLLLLGVLIGGGTMAWFTAGAQSDPASFKCGTVEIDADGAYLLEEPDSLNWNPGDSNQVEWDIYNMGSIPVEVRVAVRGAWDRNLSSNNIIFAVEDEDNWTYSNGYFYYRGGPIAAGDYVTLSATVTLDNSTGNEYMDAELEISGVVEAVQATNGAPAAVWGDDWINLF